MPIELKSIRPETWGEKLARGCTKPARHTADVIVEVCGPFVGRSHNTYTKLFRLDEKPTDDDQLQRAWLMLAVNGVDPADLGIDDSVLPVAWLPADALRQKLLDASNDRDGPTDGGQETDVGSSLRNFRVWQPVRPHVESLVGAA